MKHLRLAWACLAVAFVLGCDNGLVEVTILQTSDVHHHAGGYGPSADYTPLITRDHDGVVGGYARLAARIREVRREQHVRQVPVVLVDSGDYSVGTVYDLAADGPVGLRFLQKMGYAAATFGNHEFGYGPAGLAAQIAAARESAEGFRVPLVASNLTTSATDPRDDAVEALLADGTIVRDRVLELDNGLTVGVLGTLGPRAQAVVPAAAPLGFDHSVEHLQAQVDRLRTQVGVDLVVLLSHEGIQADGTGPDADLAAAVQGLHVIASGHTHVSTPEAFFVGNTVIMAPGEYGEGICRLDVTYNKLLDRVETVDFSLIPVDDRTRGDPRVHRWVKRIHASIGTLLESLFGEDYTPVSRTAVDLEVPSGSAHETGLGNLVGDAVHDQANRTVAGSPDETPFRFGMLPNGLIRDPIRTGFTGVVPFEDVYNALPFGNSPAAALPSANPSERLLGYPLLSFYVNAQGLFALCDIAVSLARLPGMSVYHLNFGGLRFEYTAEPHPVTTLRVQKVTFTDDGTTLTIADLADTTTVHRGAGDFFTVMMLKQGFGFPFKDRNGAPLSFANPLSLRIDTDAAAEGCQELKTWQALQGFLGERYPASGGGITEDSIYTEGHIAANPRVKLVP